MPLPNIASGKTPRCKAKCKARGDRCENPEAFGMHVRRYHGSRKASTVKRGADHPQHRHGRETREAKAERSRRLAELRALEAASYGLGLVPEGTPRWRGRRPRKIG